VLEVRKRYTSPDTGTWLEITERDGPIMKTERSLPFLAGFGRLRGYKPTYD